MTQPDTQLLLVAGTQLDQRAFRFRGRPGDDIDYAIDRVGAPQGASGSRYHFDPLDVVHQRVLRVPEDTGVKRRINTPAVDQHQQLVRKVAVEAPDGNGPGVGAGACYLATRGEPQDLGYAAEAGAADVFRRDDVDGARGLPQRLAATRYRHDPQLPQLFDGAFEQIRGGMSRQRGECECRQAGSQRHYENTFSSPSGRLAWLFCRTALNILGESRGWQD